MSVLCQVYKSPLQQEMYLFVEKERGLEDVPEQLLATFGEPQELMLLTLEPGRRLARADAAEVLQSIECQGFYLQLPPTPAQLLRRDGAGA
ncbi:MAG: YcgL domain-containing protein [Halioglobus sp.]